MSPILEARDLAVGYGSRVVGRGLALAAHPGEVVALLGPNGGGKTTLLRTLLGLLPPLAGEVRLAGQPLAAFGIAERARLLASVPQTQASAFAFTVADVVLAGRSARTGLFGRPSSADRAAAAAALERLGIAHLAERPSTMISGGERQLALIARALAQEPRAILLDEPTASLDFGNQGRVLAEIRALAAAGLGVVFSTHDPNHALRTADRAVLIRDGTLLASGPVAATLTPARLEALYGSPVVVIVEGGARAYLPAIGRDEPRERFAAHQHSR